MLQPGTNPPSEARRLSDMLRAGSDCGDRSEGGGGPLEERAETLQFVLEGAVLRQRFLADGRRHTLAVYYRDDVINLRGYVGTPHKNIDNLTALKGSVIGYVGNEHVRAMRAAAPLGLDGICVLIDRELGIAQERMVSLGRRTAVEAMAHFFCETLVRCAKPMSDHKVDRCELHMSQEMLGTVLALSSVHVNRTLQELRRLDLADVVHNELIVHNFDRLADLAEFDADYLAPL